MLNTEHIHLFLFFSFFILWCRACKNSCVFLFLLRDLLSLALFKVVFGTDGSKGVHRQSQGAPLCPCLCMMSFIFNQMKASQQFWHLLRTADKHGWIPFPLTRGHGLKAGNDVGCDADGLMTNWRLMSRYAAGRRSTCTWPIHFYLRDYKSAARRVNSSPWSVCRSYPSQGYLLIDFYAARSP